MKFPLPDVHIETIEYKKAIENPLYVCSGLSVNENEIVLQIDNVACYYIKNGNSILITILNKEEPHLIEHFLNSWGVIGILHQRKILNFHSSSFLFENKGIIVCGDSCSGKSSITAKFIQYGSTFISDDITPVVFQDENPLILSIKNNLSLRETTIQELSFQNESFLKINSLSKKHEFNILKTTQSEFPLTQILWLNVHDKNYTDITELEGIDKFTMLRGEICSWEILKGMPKTETFYMNQLIKLSQNIGITKITRPRNIAISKLVNEIQEYNLKEIAATC